MGIDAVFFIKTKAGIAGEPDLESRLPDDFTFEQLKAGQDEYYGPEGATHEVNCGYRFYGEGYERGPGHLICMVLMLLHASPDIETVWYGGDCHDLPPVCAKEDVLKLAGHFMEHGNRPYRSGR